MSNNKHLPIYIKILSLFSHFVQLFAEWVRQETALPRYSICSPRCEVAVVPTHAARSYLLLIKVKLIINV